MSGPRTKHQVPNPTPALPGRQQPVSISDRHYVHGRRLSEVPPRHREVLFGMGCFWGAERKFWSMEGVYSTSVGYAGGYTPNPTYEEVCSGQTGHAEVVRVVYDPDTVTLERLVSVFFESHDPTQGMRQGNDVGTQYRSSIYVADELELDLVAGVRSRFQRALSQAGYGEITTEVAAAVPFYFAEDYHQQYLAKNPNGYCGIGGTGVRCPLEAPDPSAQVS